MNRKTVKIVRDAILLALLCISSYLEIPTGFLPFTMQLLVVVLIILNTKPLEAFFIFSTFLIMGLIGIPVFSSGGGISYVTRLSFGFIIGFLVMPFIIKPLNIFFSKFIKRKEIYYSISSFIGVIVDYIIGVSYAILLVKVLKIVEQDWSYGQMIVSMAVIFIPFDIIKCVIASIISPRLEKINEEGQ